MRTRILSLLSVFTLLLAACGNDHSFKVIGEFKNMPEQRVRLQELSINDKIVGIDSGRTDAQGKFELAGEAPQPGLYQLIFEQGNRYVLLSIDKGNVKVSGDWQQFENYDVEGSASSKSLRNFLRVVNEHVRDIRTMDVVLDSLRIQGKDSMLTTAQEEVKGITQNLTTYIEHYADTTAYLANALFSVRMLNPVVEQPFINGFIQGLDRRFPNNAQVKEFATRFNQMMAMQNHPQEEQAFTGGPVTGAAAPEIALNTPDGKLLKLSSLKGKYVLIDFWASWCGPCRAENPNVVAAYNKFKGKDFTILGVSLDGDKDKWVEAIQKDGLAWSQVSDLKKWESIAARDYQVESIPTNFLLDKEGKIIARNLRGAALEAKLAEVLK